MRGSGNGDLYVQINTEVPISLNKEQRELLDKFRKIENEKSNPSVKQFFKKVKSFWKNQSFIPIKDSYIKITYQINYEKN